MDWGHEESKEIFLQTWGTLMFAEKYENLKGGISPQIEELLHWPSSIFLWWSIQQWGCWGAALGLAVAAQPNAWHKAW